MLTKKNYEDNLRQADYYSKLAKKAAEAREAGAPKILYAERNYKFAKAHAGRDIILALEDAGMLNTIALSESEQLWNRTLTAFVPSVCEDGDVKTLVSIIASGTDIDEADVDGDTPLMVAIAHDRAACVKYLLSVGADPYHKNKNHEDSFDIARQFNSVKSSQLLASWRKNGNTFKSSNSLRIPNSSDMKSMSKEDRTQANDSHVDSNEHRVEAEHPKSLKDALNKPMSDNAMKTLLLAVMAFFLIAGVTAATLHLASIQDQIRPVVYSHRAG